MLDSLLPILNTVLLIIIFFYQRNRNKVLEDHLASQRQLIDETKSVVTQQSAALEGQGKVVDAALKYSSAFDPQRFEDVVRREIGLEHREEIERLKREIEAKVAAPTSIQTMDTLLNVLIEAVGSATAKVSGDIVASLLPLAIQWLVTIAPSERAAAVAEVQPEQLRTKLLEISESIDARLAEAVAN